MLNRFPFLGTNQYVKVLRVAIALMLCAHGCIRAYAQTVDDFGGFLESRGFPFGILIAWGITLFEILGGMTLALGFFRKPICAVFIFILLTGIFLVHLPNGWFVVGYTSGGVEYSVLLILCLLLIASGEET